LIEGKEVFSDGVVLECLGEPVEGQAAGGGLEDRAAGWGRV